MKRRHLLVTSGISLAVAPIQGGRAQQQPRLPRIGILILDNPAGIAARLLGALRERGLEDGRTAIIEFRSAGGVLARLDELAVELVGLRVDLLIAWQTPAALAAKRASSSIPIVMSSGDPVGTGLVASLSRPGGNVTGFAVIAAEIAGKAIELMRETLPNLQRLGALINGPDPFSAPLLEQVRRSAATAGLPLHEAVISSGEALDGAIASLATARVDAILVQPSLPHARVLELTQRHRLATFSTVRDFAEAGGLLAYSSDVAETLTHVANYAERVLKGARPADLPVAQPTRFSLVINLATGRALGVAVPPSILSRADEVIE